MNDEKSFFGYVKSINRENRTLDVIASTGDVDRDGEIILPSAFTKNLESFRTNPCILACHQHRLESGESPVIGSAIIETILVTDKDLRFKMRFAETNLAENYWKLYRDGHMKAFSVGYMPLKGEVREIKSGKVFVHTEVELLEVSAVPVGSNRAALARAKRFGWIENKKQEREDIPLASEKECENFAEALLGTGKYADPASYKNFGHAPTWITDGEDEDEFVDLPDCSALVRGR
jgi:HK97 family phage prohead protease